MGVVAIDVLKNCGISSRLMPAQHEQKHWQNILELLGVQLSQGPGHSDRLKMVRLWVAIGKSKLKRPAATASRMAESAVSADNDMRVRYKNI